MTYNLANSGHSDSLEVGNAFQDFVCMELAKRGTIIQNLSSKKFQYEVGENLQGWEIKYDAWSTGCRAVNKDQKCSGRLSVEIAEKKLSGNPVFIESGIYRSDNTWMYIQGTYDKIWIFSKKMLILLHQSGRYEERENRPTVRSFMLPCDHADRYAAKVITFD